MYDSKIEEYRPSFTGTSCKYCKYHNVIIPDVYCIPPYDECILRDKIIRHLWRAKFCKYYTLKEK